MKNNKTLVAIIISILVILPVAYLVIKKKPVAANLPAQATKVDIAALEALVKDKPDYSNLINLSQAYIASNMPGKSIPYLKKAIQLDSTKAFAYNNLGVANIMLKNYQLGINACYKATQLDDKFQLAKNNLKWAIDETNNTLASIAKLESFPVDKHNADYFIQLGIYYLYIGNYDKSIAIWQEGLSKNASNVIFNNDIGTALVMKKEYDNALVEFNKVLQKEPNNQLAKNNIQWALNEKAGQ